MVSSVKEMIRKCTIIVPTLDNINYLCPTMESLGRNTIFNRYDTMVINQGDRSIEKYLTYDNDGCKLEGKQRGMFHADKPLGWMGAINYGLARIDPKTEYVVFLNDDVHILPGNFNWLADLVNVLECDSEVGAVGPSSNFVSGWQNMKHINSPSLVTVKYLIGFCMVVRKSVIDEIGGLDENLSGGDDFDFSIRIRSAGYKMVARRDVFVFHHGCKTGPRLDSTWNSKEFIEKSNMGLIRKHGFKKFFECVQNKPEAYELMYPEYGENNCFKRIVHGKGIDVGCGYNKELGAIGVDIDPATNNDVIAPGDDLPFEDNSLDYVISRHSIEHFFNPLKTLREWYRVLKPEGKLGISTPDGGRWRSINVNLEHKHEFSRETLKEFMEISGFKIEEMEGCENQFDFYCIGRKK